MTHSSTQSQEKRWQLLKVVATQRENDIAKRINFAIRKALDLLGLDIGIVSRIDGDSYTIINFQAPENAGLYEGQVFDLGDTYCAITMEIDLVTAIDHMETSEHNRHPCYKAFQLETYIGTPIFVYGKRYGTLNFSSPTPHVTKFEPQDKDLVDLLAQWVGSELESKQYRDEKLADGFREAILQNVGYAIIATDSEGVIQSFNAAAEEMLGYTKDEAVGELVASLLYDQDELVTRAAVLSERVGEKVEPRFATIAKQIYFPDEKQDERWTYIAKNGTRIQVDVFVSPIKGLGEQTTGYIGIAKDVTKTEEQARELNLRIQAMVQSPSPMTIADMRRPDQPLIYVNKAFEEQTGYAVDEAVGRNCRFLQGDDKDQEELETLRQAIKNGEACSVTLRNYRKDGSMFWNLLRLSPIHDNNGVLTHYIAVQDDITAVKSLEEEARNQQQRLAAILDSVTVPMLITKLENGRILYANESVATLFKTSRNELIGGTVPNFYTDPADRELFVSELQEKKSVDNYELLAQDANKKPFWAYLSARITVYEGITAIAATLIDITARKDAEKELKVYQEDIQLQLEASPEAIGVLNTETGLFENPNTNAEELYGLPREELIKVGPAQMSPEFQPDGRPSGEVAMAKIGEALQGGRPTFEWMHLNGQGQEIMCEVRLAPLGGNRSHLLRFSVTNITERKQASEALAARATELATVFEVSSVISAIQEPQEMLQKVVDLTKDRFDLYHAHVFLLDSSKTELILTKGADEVGRAMVAEGRTIPVNADKSLVAATARERRAQIRQYQADMEGFRPHPNLIDTRTEMAVPLLVGDELLGVLDIRSTELDAFGESEIQSYSTLAAQVAVALQNSRSLAESEKTREELATLTQRLTREGWREFTDKSDRTHHYGYNLSETLSQPKIDADESSKISEDLRIQGAKIGELKLVKPKQYDERMSNVFTAVADRLSAHLENLRLTEQTYSALADADILYQVTTKLNGVRSYDDILSAIAEQAPIAQNAEYISLNYFDTAWTETSNAESVESIAIWHNQEIVSFDLPPFYIKDYPKLANLLSPSQPLLISHIEQDERIDETFRKLYLNMFECKSTAIFPLVVADRWLGYINFSFKEAQEFNVLETDRFQTLAQQVAISAQTIYLSQQRERALAETETLYKGSEEIIKAQNYLDVLRSLLSSLDVLKRQFDHADIILFDHVWEDTNPPKSMGVVADWLGKGDKVVYAPRNIPMSMFGDKLPFSKHEPNYVADISNDERISKELADWLYSGLKTKSIITFPLVAAGDWIGLLTAHTRTTLPKLDTDDLRLITNMIDQTATVVQSIRLLEDAQKRATREARVRQITDKVRSGTDREEILRIARDEIGQLIKATKSQAQLGTKDQIQRRLNQKSV